jgi:hypothetical protein
VGLVVLSDDPWCLVEETGWLKLSMVPRPGNAVVRHALMTTQDIDYIHRSAKS